MTKQCGIVDRDEIQTLGLRSSLTPGRQNGLANIIKTVQEEVKNALAESKVKLLLVLCCVRRTGAITSRV